MRPVLFLDIDDVLCVHRTLNTREVLAALADDETVDAASVEYLRQLHEEFSPQYVISSSWTLHLDREQLCETFRRTGLEFVADNLHKHWQTPRDKHGDSYRLVEIEGWLDAHALLELIPYLVIDDLVSGQSIPGSHLEDRAVLCEAWKGFMYPQWLLAKQILRAQLLPTSDSRANS